MASISWGVTVRLDGREVAAAASQPGDAEAVQHLEVTVPSGGDPHAVELFPGSASSVQLLLLNPRRQGAALSFVAGDGDTESAEVALDVPQVYSGGSVALFGVAPNRLTLRNDDDDPVTVDIFLARDATPDDEDE